MESIFERLKRLYLEGAIDEWGLQNAVRKGLITQEQYEEIISSK